MLLMLKVAIKMLEFGFDEKEIGKQLADYLIRHYGLPEKTDNVRVICQNTISHQS